MQEKDLLQKAMQQKNMMVLYRDELVAPEYAGVPVAVENELVVLQRQTNFVLDGYCALRTGEITEAEQMRTLVEQMLTLARADNGVRPAAMV